MNKCQKWSCFDGGPSNVVWKSHNQKCPRNSDTTRKKLEISKIDSIVRYIALYNFGSFSWQILSSQSVHSPALFPPAIGFDMTKQIVKAMIWKPIRCQYMICTLIRNHCALLLNIANVLDISSAGSAKPLCCFSATEFQSMRNQSDISNTIFCSFLFGERDRIRITIQ